VTTERLSNSDIIRRFALIHLTRFPDGIRFSELKREVEESLSEYIPPDDKNKGSYRSALWDLPQRYPEYVVKDTVGRKNVSLSPTPKLLEEISTIEIPDLNNRQKKLDGENGLIGEVVELNSFISDIGTSFSPPIIIQELVSNAIDAQKREEQLIKSLDLSPDLRLIMIKHKLAELDKFLEISGLYHLLDVPNEEFKAMSNRSDAMLVILLKAHVQSIRSTRNEMFHGKLSTENED
jgi:hypothetical protein